MRERDSRRMAAGQIRRLAEHSDSIEEKALGSKESQPCRRLLYRWATSSHIVHVGSVDCPLIRRQVSNLMASYVLYLYT